MLCIGLALFLHKSPCDISKRPICDVHARPDLACCFFDVHCMFHFTALVLCPGVRLIKRNSRLARLAMSTTNPRSCGLPCDLMLIPRTMFCAQHSMTSAGAGAGAVLPPAAGVALELRVRLAEGANIDKLDVFSESDPFCVLTLNKDESTKKVSKTIQDSKEPKWNE